MDDRGPLRTGLGYAAWGYLFLTFNINFNDFSLIPNFIGWLLFLAAIRRLSVRRRDLSLLVLLAQILAAWSVLTWLHITLGSFQLPVLLVVTAAALYFHFQFLTDMAALAEQLQPPEGDLSVRLLRHRTAYVLIVTLVDLMPYFPMERLPESLSAALIFVGGIAGIIAAVCIIVCLFRLRALVPEEEEAA